MSPKKLLYILVSVVSILIVMFIFWHYYYK